MKKLLLSTAFILGLLFHVSVLAGEGGVEETISVTSTGTEDVVVEYNQEPSFVVLLQKKINVNTNKTASYSVKVCGDIYGTQYVSVTPNDTITLVDAHYKDDVTANITQEKQKFYYDEISTPEGLTAFGEITANDLSVGNWSGVLNFKIRLRDVAGLYDAKGRLLCRWEDAGINIETGFESYASAKASSTSAYYVVTNNYPNTTKIVLPDTISSIGQYGFSGCSFLTDVYLPDSVVIIGKCAFRYCTALTTVVMEDSVTKIEESAFENCSALTDIALSNSLWDIGNCAFSKCISLTDITIPTSVTGIGMFTFGDCTSLKNITFSGNDVGFAINTFQGCTAIEKIELPDGIKCLNNELFRDCSSLYCITYKNIEYTSKSALFEALEGNGVRVARDALDGTALTD